MTTNFTANGVDLDSIFAAYESGTKKPATGYQVAGVDLSDRFAPIEQGTAAAATGFLAGGSDLNTIFAATGTLSMPIAGLNGKALSSSDLETFTGDSVSASVTVNILNNGNWSVSGSNSGGAVLQPAPTTGTWIRSGVSSDYEAQIDVTHTGSATRQVTNNAATWSSLSTSRSATLALPTVTNPNGGSDADASVRIRIRRAATGYVVSDNTITMGLLIETAN